MLVIAILPITSLTMPVAIMMVMPIFVVPVVISAVVLGKCYHGRANYQVYHEKSQK